MHPILFTIPIPNSELPLSPALFALAGLGAVLALVAWWRRVPGLAAFGVALTAVAGYAAQHFRGEALAVTALDVPAWGSLVSLWLFASWQLLKASGRRLCLPAGEMENCAIVSALGALVLARALYVAIAHPEQPDLEALALRQGGLLGVGAIAGAIAAAALYLRQRQLNFWQWLDAAAPVLALGIVLVRIGCFLHGCDFGKLLPTSAPDWLTPLGTFSRWGDPDQGPVFGAAAWVQQVRAGALGPESLHAAPVHPTELYEASAGLALLGCCYILLPRRRFYGQLGLSILFAYALIRFLIEPLRGDLPRGSFGPHLTLGHYLPLGLMLFAVLFAYGPALSLARPRWRYAALLLGLVPAGLALLLIPGGGPAQQLSITQWLALFGAGGVSYAWSRRDPIGVTQGDDAAAPTRKVQEPPRSP